MADSNIAGLPAGAAIADTDLIAGSDAGSGTLVKKTASQFNTYTQNKLSNLPTTDPHILGVLWNNGGLVAISQPFTRSLAGNTGAYALSGHTATLVETITGPDTPLVAFGADLVAWYHADDATASSWVDRSGNGYTMLQPTGGNQPAVSATSFMGKSGVTLDGATTFMKATGVALSSNKFTVYAFAQFTTNSDGFNDRLVAFEGNGVGNDFTAPGSAVLIGGKGDTAQLMGERSGALSNFQFSATPDVTVPTVGSFYRMGSEWDSANHTFYAENEAATPVASTGSLASPGNLRIGSFMDGVTAFYQGIVREIVVVKNTVTSLQRQNLLAHLGRDWARILLTEGDSITYSPAIDSGFTCLFLPNAAPPVLLQNRAIGGARLADLVSRVSTRLYNQIPTTKYGQLYIVFVGIGTNDLMQYMGLGTTAAAAQYAADLATYCAGIKAAGADKIVISTIMSRIDAPYPDQDIYRHPYNTTILNPSWQAANGIDAVADFGGDAIMGVDLAPSVNPTYFADDVHPSPLGNARLETIFRATINSL